MTTNSFIHLDYPSSHPGAERLERMAQAARRVVKKMSVSRGLAALLLVAVAATLFLVTDLLVDTWTDGHLMIAWVLTWVLGIAALALLAPAARLLVARMGQALDTWSRNLANRRADERLWALASKDPRVMADIRAAMLREEVALDAGKGQVSVTNAMGNTGTSGGGQSPKQEQGAGKDQAALDINASEFVSALIASRGLRPEVAARLSRLSRRIWNE
jgi:hypothetical protein